MDEKAYAAYTLFGDVNLIICDVSVGFSEKLYGHLWRNPPHKGDSTSLSAFVFDGGPASGKLENTMPDSTFTHFTFERHDFGSKQDPVTFVVGWYWTEDE